MTSESDRWWRAIRRSWGVPDVVGDEGAREAIARKLADEAMEQVPVDQRGGRAYGSVVANTGAYVDALRSAANDGDLDLAASGVGKVTTVDGWVTIERPDEYAADAVKKRATAVDGAEWASVVSDCPEKLWSTLKAYLDTYPFDDGA